MAEWQPVVEISYKTIVVERRGPVCSITLNKPPMNIIDIEMMDEIQAVLRELEEAGNDSGVRVLVLRGAGEKGFSAGVSIQDHTPDRIGAMIHRFHDIIRRLSRTNLVTLAVVHGLCLGGGFELVSICDLVVASDNSQLGQPEIKLGQLPPVAVVLLPYLVGYHKAAELILTGESIGAREALALGLVNRVVPQGDLSGCVESLLAGLMDKSASTLRLGKSILRRVAGEGFEKALDESERFFLQSLVPTEDAQEGVFAFLEKRAPQWRHR